MAIIGFIIIFIIIGFIIKIAIKNNGLAMRTIVAISIFWAFVMGPWAIATFIELMLGYALAKQIVKT